MKENNNQEEIYLLAKVIIGKWIIKASWRSSGGDGSLHNYKCLWKNKVIKKKNFLLSKVVKWVNKWIMNAEWRSGGR
jgi:hypothetical protein